MKRLIYISVLTLSTVLLSCEKYLKEEPKTFLSPANFFNNYKEGKLALNGCYDMLGNISVQYANYYQGYWMTNMLNDEMTWATSGINPYRDIYSAEHSASNVNILNAWQHYYKVIGVCNFTIYGIEGSAGISEAEKQLLLSEAKFIRALFYFNMANLWGDIPLILQPTLSIDGNEIPKNQGIDVFNAVIEDLKYAELYLPKKQTEVGRATKGAAKMLLAKAYMQIAGYPYNKTDKMALALEKCREIITDAEYGYGLQTSFGDVFKESNENNSEVIFDVQFKEGPDEGSILGAYFFGKNGLLTCGGSGGTAFLLPAFSDSFKTGDLRKGFTVATTNCSGAAVAKIVYRNCKYQRVAPYPALASGGNNFIVLRYADLLLMAAEAINQLSPNDAIAMQEAYGYINQVRRRAYGKPLNTAAVGIDIAGRTGQDFLNDIIEERRWELSGEGWRWFDLKRWHIMKERLVAGASSAAAAVSEKHYHLPIPQTELQANPSLEQHTDWKN